MRDHCESPNGRLLRYVCGETCGCSDPSPGPQHLKNELRMLQAVGFAGIRHEVVQCGILLMSDGTMCV